MRTLPYAKPARKEKKPRKFGSSLPISEKRPKSSGRIKPKPRPKAETERAHGSEERRAWTKRQPCIVPGCGRTPCDAAHLINGGIGRKANASWTVPFCSTIVATGYEGHHDQYDNGKRSFLAKHFPGQERADIAAPIEAAWQAHTNRND